uniref:C-C motif chemokine n=2 Tax=Astyanax mexicanus TaxID=7994 RepID=A0A3B1KKB0_ASTMX
MDKLYTGLLLSALILSCFIVETQTASCCLSYTRRRLYCENLRGFTIQTIYGHCDLDAVIFRTWNNKFICADPNKKRTQEMVRCLKTKVEHMNHGLI